MRLSIYKRGQLHRVDASLGAFENFVLVVLVSDPLTYVGYSTEEHIQEPGYCRVLRRFFKMNG
jgi:hypothetical protein